MTDAPVVLINVFKCAPDKQGLLVELVKVMARAQTDLPGFVSATVHRGLSGKTVANHVVWRSHDEARAVRTAPAVVAAMAPIMAIATFEPHLYDAGETIG